LIMVYTTISVISLNITSQNVIRGLGEQREGVQRELHPNDMCQIVT